MPQTLQDRIRQARAQAKSPADPPEVQSTTTLRDRIQAAREAARSPAEERSRRVRSGLRHRIQEARISVGSQVSRPALEPPRAGTPDPLRPAHSPSEVLQAPRNIQLRNALNDISGGLLQNAGQLDDTRGPGSIVEFTTKEWQRAQAANPAAVGAISRVETAQDKEIFRPLVDLAAAINHSPPSPREVFQIADRARGDWISLLQHGAGALGTRRAGEGVGPTLIPVDRQVEPPTTAEAASQVPPELHQEVIAKLLHAPPGRTPTGLLQSDGPLGDEQAAYQALGGDQYLEFLRSREPFYRSLHRSERVLGKRTRPPPRSIDEIPTEPDLTALDLTPLIPGVHDLKGQIERSQDRQATEELQRDAALAKFPLLYYSRRLHQTGGAAGLAGRALQNFGTILDQGLAGIPSASFQALSSAITGTVADESWQLMKARFSRHFMSHDESDDAQSEYNHFLANYGDLGTDASVFEAGRIFSTTRMAKSWDYDWLGAALNADPDGVREAVGTLGTVFDDPTEAIATLGIIGAPFSGALRRRAIRKARARAATARGTLAEDLVANTELSGQTQFAAETRARLVGDTFDRIRRTAKNPAEAKQFLETMVQDMGDAGVGMSPEVFGKIRTAWDWFDSASGRGLFRRMDPRRATIWEHLGESIGPDDFFDSAFVRTPEGQRALNPRAPAEIVAKAERLVQQAHRGLDAAARELPGPKAKTIARTIRGTFEAHNQLRDLARRQAQVSGILDLVSQDLGHTHGALRQYRDALTGRRTEIIDTNNALFRDEILRAHRAELEGTTILEANPAVKSKAYLRAEQLQRDTAAAADYAYSKSGQVNRQGLQSIGGNELAQEVLELDRQARDIGRPGANRDLIGQAVREAAAAHVEAVLKPIERTIPKARKPRNATFQHMRKQLDEATEAGKLYEPAPAELAVLNETRPHAPLRPKGKRWLKAVDTDLDRTTKSLERTTALLDGISKTQKKLQLEAPGKVRQVSIPASLRKDVENYMSDPVNARLLYDRERGVIPLNDTGAQPMTVLETWRDSLEALSKETVQLRNHIYDQSSFELAQLPVHEQARSLKAVGESTLHYANEVKRRAATIMSELRRNVEPEELGQMMRAIQSGDTRGLRSDAAQWVLNEMYRLRVHMLDRHLADTRLTPGMYAKFVNERYTHRSYLPDEVAAETQNKQLQKIRGVEDAIRFVAMDGRHFLFKRPTDSHYVTWLEKGTQQHKKGFKTEAEASAWAQKNLPESDYQVHPPFDDLDQLLRQRIDDVAIPFGQLMKAFALDEARYRYQAFFARLPDLVRNTADVRRKLELDGQKNVAEQVRSGKVTLGGQEFVLVRTDGLPDLKGKWVHKGTLLEQAERVRGIDLWSAMSSAIEGTLRQAINARRTGLQKAVGQAGWHVAQRFVRTTNNILALAKVPLQFPAYALGLMGNVVNSYLAGIGILDPAAWPIHARNASRIIREAVRELPQALRHRDAERLHLTKEPAPLIREMYEEDLIHVGDAVFDDEMARAMDRHTKQADGIQRRIDAMLEQLDRDDLSVERRAAAEAELARLEDNLHEAAKSGLSDIVKNHIKTLGKGIIGEGSGVRKIWAAFGHLSGDVFFKALAYYFYREAEGLSRSAAAARVRRHYQMLHEPKRLASKVARSPAGSMFMGFKLEQARLLANAARYSLPRLVKFFPMLAAYNSAQIAGSGLNQEEYLEGHARSMNSRRSPITDLSALAGRVNIGTDPEDGGLHSLSLKYGFGWFFGETFGPVGSRLGDLIRGGSKNAAWNTLAETVGGTTESFLASNAASSLVLSIAQGQTPMGTPVHEAGETAVDLFAPSWFPGGLGLPAGFDARRLSRIARSQDRSPSTHELKGLGAFAAERLARIRKLQSTPQKIQAAMSFIKTGDDEQRKTEVRRLELREDRAAFKVATLAMRRDGTFDHEKLREIAIEELRKNQPALFTPEGEPLEATEGIPPKEILRKMEEIAEPTLLRRFNNSTLVDQLNIYSMWRRTDSLPAKQWEQHLRNSIMSKLRSRQIAEDDYINATTLLKGALTSEGLPDDAKFFLRGVGHQIGSIMESKARN